MYIRKRKNKSGSYSVLLCIGERTFGKKNSTSRMIKSFGSAKDEQHLQQLFLEAETYKRQLELSSPKAKTLRISSELDIRSCLSYNVGFSDVYGHVFSSIFNTLNLKNNLLQRLKDLVIMRIAEPCSKRRTANIAMGYGISLNVDVIYKLMDQINAPTIDQIKKIIYSHTVELLKEQKQTIDVLFYDLTTIYFETGTQDELRDFGFSKDGKHQHVQIMLAIIVTKEGLLIDYEEFPGNSYEGHTLIPVLHKIQERYHIDNTVIVADAALMNKINLEELDSHGIKYIIAARLKNAKKEIKKTVLDASDYKIISNYSDVEDGTYDAIKSKIISCDSGDFIFAYHSTKRARKDTYDREKDLEKIKKHISSTAKSKLTGSLKKSYIKISKNCKIEIDYEKLKIEALYDGFFGLRTNIKDADPVDILGSYRGLWQVEQTFRIAKTNLEIRPVFHYTPRRIRAHFLVCYMALALIRHVQFMLKTNGIPIPCDELYLLLSRMRKVQMVNADNDVFEFLEDPPTELISAYQALKIKWRKKFQYLPKM